MYEAGFQGFWLHDLLEKDGIDCIVTPPNKVVQEKDNRVKTDKVDARRLAKNLENGVICHVLQPVKRWDHLADLPAASTRPATQSIAVV